MTGLIPRFCPHCNGPLDVNRVVAWGGWSYDEENRVLDPGVPGKFMYLTKSEGLMLGAILRAGGRHVSKQGGLYAAACGNRPDVDWPDFQIVDVYVSKLRRKLREYYGIPVLIATQWGVGYYAVPHGEVPVMPPNMGRKNGKNRGGRPLSKRLVP